MEMGGETMTVFQFIFSMMLLLVIGATMIMHQVSRMVRNKKPSQDEQLLKTEIASLQKRTETLERIVTDRKHIIKEEIETL